MVLAKFRQHYPQGSLVSELIDIDRGTYIVGVSVIINNIVLSTGLAGADTVETAEDLARERAIAALMLDSYNLSESGNLDRTKSQNNAVTGITKEALTKAASSEQKLTLEDKSSIENDKVQLPEDIAPPVVQSAPNVLSSTEDSTLTTPLSFEPEIQEQTNNNDVAVEETAAPLTEQSVSSSANLFAGTSNLDAYKALQDNPTSSEASEKTSTTSAINAETSQVDILEEVNFNEIKHQTDLEIKRLGWTKDDGREFLKSRYGKRSRLQLTDRQLLEFLQYLASQPSPS